MFKSKKSLSIALSKLKGFQKQDVELEQYPTEPDICADSLWIANGLVNLQGKTVADFGCGNGLFGIGALLLGAKKAYFVDIDAGILNIARENLKSLGLLKKAVLLNQNIKDFSKANKKIDIVIQNPPFGVQHTHNDKLFLFNAMETASAIFTFHKLSTRKFVEAFARDNRFDCFLLKRYNFPLKKTFWFHISRVKYIGVGLWFLRRQF